MKDVLDENEVAEILDCEPSTVQEKARAGELPAVKFGRSWRFPRAALMEALHKKAMENRPKKTTSVGVKFPAGRRAPPPLPAL